MVNYSDDPKWADITPIPQDDGGPHPLAAIAYSDEYSEAMGYLRAVMAKEEHSERVLDLTEHIIEMNPAHYTVWLYRAKTLKELNFDLKTEIEWLNPAALKHLKNYQIWHHRQTIISQLNDPAGETDFIDTMLGPDSKNYHVWSYRQWLVKQFGLWKGEEGQKELDWVDGMIGDDVRNNSAWNHRWFVVFGCGEENIRDEAIVNREMGYAKAAIHKAPQNQSPWNYLHGIIRGSKTALSSLKDFALQFASLENPDDVHSSHALDLLAMIYAQDEDTKEKARQAFDLLANKYDPVRKPYWNYRKETLVN
ncbi:farnesyltransferas-like protein [Delitschia confertaspora ATCC 74209]|uniref:Protein farnesyltransferase/geranylgeranyltransferase type-1 subunit alpha n=1 Tax=Delitschia confertaspora ATCC 74209 TaxID=1513339 RepID=A0A9P4MYE5_9PLEO|nr:farnesyltransferas-like protein [Delitschia confertaspora ATCC 74209]